MTSRRSTFARLLLLTLLSTGIVLTLAQAASAHATLVSTTPADGSVLHRPLAAVSVTFDESVGITTDSLRVYAPDGSRVDTGGAQHLTAQRVDVRLQPALAPGTYTAAWQVVSADSHPVSGAFTFSLGHRSGHVEAADVKVDANGVVQAGYDVVRGLSFLAFAAFVGGIGFLLICWPGGAGDPRMRGVLVVSWAVSLSGAALSFLLQGPYGADAGLSHLVDPPLLSNTISSRIGGLLVARVVILVVAGLLARGLLTLAGGADGRRRIELITSWAIISVLLAGTWSLGGHAAVGRQVPLSVADDIAHLLSVAGWLGGVIAISVALARGRDSAVVLRAVRSFSPFAGWCVVLIIVTGTYQTWRNVGHWAALVDTTYGLLVVAKISGLALIIALGYVARRLLSDRLLRRASPSAAPLTQSQATRVLQRLRISITFEVVIALVVLAFASVLVNTQTGRESYHPVVSASRSFDTGTARGWVTVVVTPATLGPQTVGLSIVDARGAAYRPVEVQVTMTLPSQGIGPLQLKVVPGALGHYSTAPEPIGVAGDWLVSVTIRSSAFDETTVQVPTQIS